MSVEVTASSSKITATASGSAVQAAVGSTTVSASSSGGIGPQGPAGTPGEPGPQGDLPPVIDGNASGESALLLHCNGDDGSTAISDSGADTLEVTAQGGAIISTAQSKFGGSSVFLPGSGSCLRITGDLAFGTGDFTVDAWLYMTGGGAFPGILEIGAHLATTGVLFLANAGGALYSAGWNGTLTVPLNEWVHVAWVREGGVLTVYVNGTSTGSSSFTNDLSDSATITIGNKFSNDPNYNFTGWIDELRIASSAVWSANFTPPTSPYASSSATTMLQRRGAAAELENITLGPGQIAYETDTGKVKIGDGSTVYSDLDYISDGGGGGGEYLPLAGGTMEGNIVFDETGGQFIGKGLVDTSRGGSYGISLVCSVGYQFNWQAGWVLATEQNGSTPRPLYLDSAAGTTLRVWDAAENEGVEVAHDGITFSDATNQTTAWTGSFSYDDLDDLPTLFSGSYDDLSGKPTLFDGAYTSLTSVPSTFAPSAHKSSHATGGADALTAADIGAAASSHSHSWSNITSGVPSTFTPPAATTSTIGGVIVGTGLGVTSGTISVSYGTSSSTACVGNDARLSDARVPTSHNQAWSTITSTPTTLSGYGISDAVSSSDSRLTNSRTPTAHTHGLGDLTQGGATTGQVIAWSGSAWAPATVSGGGGSASDLTSGTLADARLSAKAQSALNLYLWSNFR